MPQELPQNRLPAKREVKLHISTKIIAQTGHSQFEIRLEIKTTINMIKKLVTRSKGSWSQLVHVKAEVFIDFLDLLNIDKVEFGLCRLSRLME